MVHWHAVTQADFSREQTREAIREGLSNTPNGAQIFAEFDTMDDTVAA